jgi:hypothetical protein
LNGPVCAVARSTILNGAYAVSHRYQTRVCASLGGWSQPCSKGIYAFSAALYS